MARKKGVKQWLAQERFQRGGTIDWPRSVCFASRLKRTISFSSVRESRLEQITSLGEQRRQGVPVVLQPACGLCTEKLICFFARDAQLAEQPHEARIGA